ncbi:MAG: SpoIIE family protein phosphatase, partial [Gammaproteobacteria bacterium]|nr:SpoIIE family protein phosphatase [Gammaproteobacteria bacterium]
MLDNDFLSDEFLNRVEIINKLEDLIQAFACSLDIDDAMRVTLHKMLEYMDAEAASIFMLNRFDQLICHGCAGQVDIQDPTLKMGMKVVKRAVDESKVILVKDTSCSDDFIQDESDGSGITTRSIVCAPLVIRGETIGAVELINKVVSPDNPVGRFDDSDSHLLSLLCASAALAIHNAIMAEEVVRSGKVQEQLDIARSIQESFLPASNNKQPIVGLNIPARNMSGDFFDFLLLPNGKYMFNIGDVSGKGIEAALLMAKGSSLYHCLAKTIDSPAEILQVINRELQEMTTRGLYITMIGGIYDPETRQVTLANAGHPPAIHDSGQRQFTLYESLSPPVGIIPEQQFEEVSFSLAKGSLYLYTDGLSEGLVRHTDGLDEVTGLLSLIRR